MSWIEPPRRYWELHVAQRLSQEDREAAKVYFPIVGDQNAFDSTLGLWRWKSVRSQHQVVYDFLLSQQPFTKTDNGWLAVLNDLAVQGKHIDLVPQKRTEERRTTATSAEGSVSWGQNSLSFGPGGSIGFGPGGQIAFGPGGVRFSVACLFSTQSGHAGPYTHV